jgi:hypothetical protein
MKDVISLVITTSCLAVVGLGIYFFTSNKDENDKSNQKGGKKISNSGNNNVKKINEPEDKYEEDDYNKIDEYDETSEDDYNDYDDYTPHKSKTKANNKTKKNKNKLSASKRRYY